MTSTQAKCAVVLTLLLSGCARCRACGIERRLHWGQEHVFVEAGR